MPKKKKTKEQKRLAEIHRKQHFSTQQQYTFSTDDVLKPIEDKIVAKKLNTTPTTVATNADNQYLMHDLRKTLLLTGTIIFIQIVLRIFIK